MFQSVYHVVFPCTQCCHPMYTMLTLCSHPTCKGSKEVNHLTLSGRYCVKGREVLELCSLILIRTTWLTWTKQGS